MVILYVLNVLYIKLIFYNIKNYEKICQECYFLTLAKERGINIKNIYSFINEYNHNFHDYLTICDELDLLALQLSQDELSVINQLKKDIPNQVLLTQFKKQVKEMSLQVNYLQQKLGTLLLHNGLIIPIQMIVNDDPKNDDDDDEFF